MSNPKTAINEIKNLMVKFGFMSEEPVKASFKLEDNTILQTSKLEVGNEIVKINEEFEQVKLEDGSYRLVENFNSFSNLIVQTFVLTARHKLIY